MRVDVSNSPTIRANTCHPGWNGTEQTARIAFTYGHGYPKKLTSPSAIYCTSGMARCKKEEKPIVVKFEIEGPLLMFPDCRSKAADGDSDVKRFFGILDRNCDGLFRR